MRFFEKQKVDQVGIMSVALQKVLIFLMIVNIFSMFNAGGLLSFFLCLIGFIGAVKRRPCLLMVYFTISVIIMVIAFTVGMYMIIGLAFYAPSMQNDLYNSESTASLSESSASASSAIHPMVQHAMRSLFSLASSSSSSSISSSDSPASSISSSDSFASSSITNSLASDSWSFGSTSAQVVYASSTTGFALAFLFMILAFFLAYMKMFSLVLAWRLRKMILATPVLPTEYVVQPQDNSCAENEQEEQQFEQPPIHMTPYPMPPMFNHPGYMPFTPMPMPNMQQQFNGANVPPPMMYGQFPVYYSFAPIPQTPSAPNAEENNSKL